MDTWLAQADPCAGGNPRTGKLHGFESSNIKQRRSWSAVCIFFLSREFCCKILSFCDRSRESGKLPGPACASPLFGCHSKVRCRCRWVLLCLMPQVTRVKGVDAELTEIGGRDPLRHDGPAPRRQDGYTTAARVRVAVFVRSEKSNALVGDGVLQPAPRSANLDSAFGGMQLFATVRSLESSSSAAHTLCTVDTAYCAAATAVTAMGSPSLALSRLCCGLCERHCSATAGTL